MGFQLPRLKLFCLPAFLFLAAAAFSQQTPNRPRIVDRVDDSRLVTLRGNTHPLARPQFDQGPAPDNLPINRMLLLLSRSPEQQAALDKFVEELHAPESPNYRHWLTPTEFGQRFGPADADIQKVTGWLQQQGFSGTRVAAGRSVIEFSGSAAQLRSAFHTAIHQYAVNGKEHWANSQDPKIPEALSPVVGGVVSLNNFPRRPLSHRVGVFSRDQEGTIKPEVTLTGSSGTYYGVGPADFATIYNSNPLLQAASNGAGQTIAIIGRSNVHLQDITDFRNFFGLGAGNTSVVIDGPDPGIVKGDESESVLDLEWANAVAPGASIVLVSAQSTETTSGIDLAALHVIENDMAGVMSVSYGICEAHLGTAGNQYIQSLWEQAAAQGITVVVATGDTGSAGCDNQNLEDVAQSGLAINGAAATAFNVAVGGTDFDDAGTQTSYWNSTNDPTTAGSARSYIPETSWNQTCAASATAGNLNVCPAMPTTGPPPASLNLLAGSGGPSTCSVSTSSGGTIACQNGRPKPSWQNGVGVPSDGVRDIPDVSLFAAAGSNSKSFYIVCQADELPIGFPSCQRSSTGSVYFLGEGGTSAAAPSFAGIVALAEQKTGVRLGNLNYLLYSLAAGSGASCASSASPGSSCVFNDVIKGNNSVPCQVGSANCSQGSGAGTGVIVDASQTPVYAAGSGYDLTTGLGSVNAANLVNGIANAVHGFSATSTNLSLNGSTAALTAQHGDSINVGVSVTPAGSGDVSLLGSSGGFDFGTVSAGTANWASTLFPGGTYAVKAHYAGDSSHGASDSSAISVTINPEPSQSFINLVTFDAKVFLQSFTGNSVNYGSNYLLRVDVTDAAGNVSSAQGVSSKCSNRTASCPTGTVTVSANGSPLDGGSLRLNSRGFAEDQIIQLNAGTYTLGTSYSGDASYGASSGSSAVSILKAPTTLTGALAVLPPYQYGTAYQIDAALATTSSGAAPSGTISFIDNGAPAGTSVHPVIRNPQPAGPNGYASLTFQGFYATPTVGTHTVNAQFSGDPNYADSSSSSFSFTVGKADTRPQSYSVRPMNTIPTLPVTLYAQFFTNSQMAEPTGTITFYDNGNPIAGTVTYAGQDGSWNGGGGNFIASYSGQLITTFTQLGNHALGVTYAGDANYNPTTQNLGTLVVATKLPVNFNPVAASMSPALVSYPTNLSASIFSPSPSGTPMPTGTFSFFDNGQPLSGTITYSNPGSNALAATLPYTFTTTGAHSITASYSGDSNYASASSAQALSLSVIDKLPTFILGFGATGGIVNQPVVLSLNIDSNYVYNGPVMTGTVTFQDGNTPIPGTVTYASQQGYMTASVPYTFTTAGTHNIGVQYSGDSHYAPTSATLTDTILGPLSVQLLGGNTMTMSARGGAGFVNINVINTTSSAMSVNLSCVPDSTSATCSVTSPFDVQANTTRGTTVNFNIPALTGSVYHANPFTMTFVFAGVLAGLSFTSRKRNPAMLMMLVAVMAITLGSCGGGGGGGSSGNPGTGGGGSSGTPLSRTYKFTITATSGANTDTQVLTVTEQ